MPVLEISTHPSLHAAIVSRGDAGVGIEALAWQLSVNLTSEADVEEGREGVGEVQDEKSADKTDDTVEIRHSGSNDEGNDPVDGAKGVPHPATFLGSDFWEVENLLEDLDVHSLHSDVEVKHCNCVN